MKHLWLAIIYSIALALLTLGLVVRVAAAPTANVLVGGIVLNEILIDPNASHENFDTDGNGTASDLDEFVELYNASGGPIDISAYQLWDDSAGNWFTFPADTVLGAGSFAVVVVGVQAGGTLPPVSGGNLAFDAALPNAILDNSGDNVVLYNPHHNEYIQLHFNGDAADNPPAVYPGFPALATLVGDVEAFGDDLDGVSLVREPAGDVNIVQHNTISPDNASPGHGGGPTAITLTRLDVATVAAPYLWGSALGSLALLTLGCSLGSRLILRRHRQTL